MKIFFKTFIELLMGLTFIINPIALTANEIKFQENGISTQGMNNSQERKNSTQTIHNKSYEQKRKKQTNKYRPKSYRKIAGGILAAVGVISAFGALIIATIYVFPFLLFGGAQMAFFVIMGCGGLLCIPLTIHVAGLQLLDSE